MIFLVIQWILIIVKVSEGITDTCPSTAILPFTRVLRMCQPTIVTASEDVRNGNSNFDSVFFSLTEQEDNCSCIVSIKNVTIDTTLYIKRYNNFSDQLLCGMEIDIYQLRASEIKKIPDPIPSRCSSKNHTKTFSYTKNEKPMLMFLSRVVDGYFSMGYCIQIQRVHTNGGKDGSFLEIACGNKEITKSKATYTTTNPLTTLNDVTTSSELLSPTSSPPTSMINKSHINDKTDSEGDSTLYIAVGAGGGFVLFVSLLVVIFVCKRRNLNHSSKGETRANGKATTATDVDDDNDGLKYNVLYVSSEHEDMDVNYSTADDAMPSHAIGDDEGGYSTVDENNKFQISNLRKYQVTDAALEINEENGVKHINAPIESGCVYAVVEKTQNSNNSVKNVETGATYAVVNKKRLRHSNEGDK